MTKPTEGAICTKISNCVEVFEQMVRSLTACYISFKPGFIASLDRLYIFEILYVIRKYKPFSDPSPGHLSMSIVKCHKERLYSAQDTVCIQRKNVCIHWTFGPCGNCSAAHIQYSPRVFRKPRWKFHGVKRPVSHRGHGVTRCVFIVNTHEGSPYLK